MRAFDRSSADLLVLRQDEVALGVSEAEWRRLLESAQPDSAVGIRHAAISGTEHHRLHVASIPERVGCHFHRVGEEQYSVVQGQGTMHFGLVEEGGDAPTVRVWRQLDVRVGDTFTIPQQYAHQLCSSGTDELVIVFACPDSHLDDRDRTLLADAPNLCITKSPSGTASAGE
jgi:mannose-6-phosphate isomerase-like protein (cupin superfamily)